MFSSRKKCPWKCICILHWRRMEEGTCPSAEGIITEIWWEIRVVKGLPAQPSSAGWWFLLVLLSAHSRLPSGLTILCNSDPSHHVAHIFSIEKGENCFKLLAILSKEKKSRGYYFLQETGFFLNQYHVSAKRFQQLKSFLLIAPYFLRMKCREVKHYQEK